MRASHIVPEVFAFEAGKIEMEERQPAAEMFVQDHERRARDVRRVETEAGRDPLREDGLPRPELAPQGDDIAWTREARETLTDALGMK